MERRKPNSGYVLQEVYKCIKCKIDKPISEFWPSVIYRGSYRCIECHKLFPSVKNSRARAKERYKKLNPGYISHEERKQRGLEIKNTGMYKCTRCGIIKPLNAFRKDKRKLAGIEKQCKECKRLERRAIARRYVESHRDKVRELYRKYRQANRDKIRLYRMAKRQEERKVLADEYIKRLITRYSSLGNKDIPVGLIDLYRRNLIVKRLMRSR